MRKILVTATNVLLINEYEMFTDIMQQVLAAEGDMAVVGSASAATAVDAIQRTNPDVVVLDYDIANGRGADIARGIQAGTVETRIVMLIGAPNGASVRESISAGCLGVVCKARGASDLIGAVRSVARGHSVAAVPQLDAMLDSAAAGQPQTLLTARQHEILCHMAQGLSTDALAAVLGVSRNTIRSHVHQILVKLKAKSKLQAVSNARKAGLIA